MSKKRRLGSDPLSWINDSREAETQEKVPNPPTGVPEIKSDPPPENLVPFGEMEQITDSTYKLKKTAVTEQNPAQTEYKRPTEADISRPNENNLLKTQENEPFQEGINPKGGKFLAFCIGKEEYGIHILKIQEIIGMLPITEVPNTRHFIRGVVNLRGKVIPVIELRLKCGMATVEYTRQTCIIVIQVCGNLIGVIVDNVSEVIHFTGEEIADTPSFGDTEIDTEYIMGIGKIKKRVTILLDIDKVLSFDKWKMNRESEKDLP